MVERWQHCVTTTILSCAISKSICQLYEEDSEYRSAPLPKRPVIYDLIPPWPKMIIFDFDYTLWPFWVDTHVDLPFSLKWPVGNIPDFDYPAVKHIFKSLKKKCCILAVTARFKHKDEVESAEYLYKFHRLHKYFRYKFLGMGTSVDHIKRFKEESKIDYINMMYISHKKAEAIQVSYLNVTTIITTEEKDELTDMALLRKGFRVYRHYHQTANGTQVAYSGPLYFVVTDRNVKT